MLGVSEPGNLERLGLAEFWGREVGPSLLKLESPVLKICRKEGSEWGIRDRHGGEASALIREFNIHTYMQTQTCTGILETRIF